MLLKVVEKEYEHAKEADTATCRIEFFKLFITTKHLRYIIKL